MANSITNAQYDELYNGSLLYGLTEVNPLLERLTGIVAKPYTAYNYYDASGDYIGSSEEMGIDDLLKAAYVEVKDG